jgi:hypothetical protein
MNKYLVVVIGGMRTRFFTPKQAEFPENGFASNLLEHKSLSYVAAKFNKPSTYLPRIHQYFGGIN